MSCESETHCSTQSCSHPPKHTHASCDSHQCCPIEKKIELWQHSFCEALHGTMVDILKEKIRSRWGEKMSREGDAVVNSMETQWQSMLAQGKAKHQLQEDIRNIIIGG